MNNFRNNQYLYPTSNFSTHSINRGSSPPVPKKPPPKKKFDFKLIKKNTCTSLNEIECFLNNFTDFLKYIKIIKLLK